MLWKIKGTVLTLAVAAVLLAASAGAIECNEQCVQEPESAAEYAEQSVQDEENCIEDVVAYFAERKKDGDSAEGGLFVKREIKNGFEMQDGKLYHYTEDELDVYQPGFVQIEDGTYHVSNEGGEIDVYQAGFVTVEDVLCHVSEEGGCFDIYPAGFVTIDGKLHHVSQEGYVIDSYSAGLHEIDGGMYYVAEDGAFLTDGAVGHLTFGSDGRYTSGNETLDSYVDQALAECTNSGMTQAEKLRAAYLYVREHGAYLARPHQPRGTTDWAEESALFMFENKKGNCYCFAGQFLYMARRIGYDAYVVSGGVGRRDSDHAWVMIHENGTPYIYDVELEWGYRVGKYGKVNYNMYKMPLNKTVFSYQFP